jgi:hypothetical protein
MTQTEVSRGRGAFSRVRDGPACYRVPKRAPTLPRTASEREWLWLHRNAAVSKLNGRERWQRQ